MAKVLFIDGSWYGHVRDDVNGLAFQFADYSNATPVSVPVGTYWVHRCAIAGRVLLLGSISYETPDNLADEVFWDLLASDKAREVAQVVEGVAASREGG